MENWFKAGVQFECTACGKCCQVPQYLSPEYATVAFPGASIDDEEVSRMAAHANLPEAEFRERFVTVSRLGFQALKVSDGACAFYDKDTKLCKAHEARPSSCKALPFWWNMHAKMFWDGAKSSCEGINQGPLISEAEILAKLSQRKPNVYPGVPPAVSPVPDGELAYVSMDPRYADD